jgi:hypothetical protein
VRVPLALGLNTSVDVHELREMLKSPALVPEIATVEKVTEDEVALVMSTDCAVLLEPIAVEAKVRLDGLAERALGTTPSPLSGTV